MIPLWKYIPIINGDKYKLHYMRSNENYVRSNENYEGGNHPFDCTKEEIMNDWQNWRGGENRWGNAEYIFALLQDPHDIEKWFFAGIYKILEKEEGKYYKTTILDNYQELMGRLKIRSSYKGQESYPYLSKHYNDLEIYEILSEPCKPFL